MQQGLTATWWCGEGTESIEALPQIRRLVEACAAFGREVTQLLPSTSAVAATDASSSSAGGIAAEFGLKNPACNQLLPHQVDGVRWLLALFENAVNGVLADEMGLGKTVQVIAFLCALCKQRYFGTHLIVVPLSTLDNWSREIRRWAPWLPLVVYHGGAADRAETRKWIQKRYQRAWASKGELERRMSSGATMESIAEDVGGIVLTTFEMVMHDRAPLCRLIPWDLLIVDEAHRLKNMNCKLLHVLRQGTFEGRLLLTGTPLQNNATELWAILNFLLPDLFTDAQAFKVWFRHAEQLSAPRDNEVDNDGDDNGQNRRQQGRRATPFAAGDDGDAGDASSTCSSDVEDGEAKGEAPQPQAAPPQKRSLRSLFTVDNANEAHQPSAASASLEPVVTVTSLPTIDDVRSVVSSIHAALRPFILRRTKADIPSLNIPPKFEVIVHAPMLKEQQAQYEAVKRKPRYDNNRMMHLRKVCCHPFLLEEFDDASQAAAVTDGGGGGAAAAVKASEARLQSLLSSCAKLQILDKMLRALIGPLRSRTGHKILLFSQMTRVLDVIEEYFTCLNHVAAHNRSSGGGNRRRRENGKEFTIPYVRLDGSCTYEDRVNSIRKFSGDKTSSRDRKRQRGDGTEEDDDGIFGNRETTEGDRRSGVEGDQMGGEEDPVVFLISTRSGGVGLNLVAADTVILYDGDFNPFNDQQAIDRCHRIGQTRPVVVYRVVSPNTVEDAMMQIALRKKRLEGVVLGCGKFHSPSIPVSDSDDETLMLQQLTMRLSFADVSSTHTLTDAEISDLMDRTKVIELCRRQA